MKKQMTLSQRIKKFDNDNDIILLIILLFFLYALGVMFAIRIYLNLLLNPIPNEIYFEGAIAGVSLVGATWTTLDIILSLFVREKHQCIKR